MGYLKYKKQGTPFRPIVSNRGAVPCGMAEKLANILRPLVGHFPHHIKKTQHFVDHLNSIKVEEGECIASYDVMALFTSVPVDPAISITKQNIQQDTQLQNRTFMSIEHVSTLLGLCLNTHFLLQG